MSSATLYFDEDAQAHALILAVRTIPLDVLTSTEAGMDGRSDVDQLRFAASLGRTVVTRNIRDFRRLHAQFMRTDRHHSGMLLVHAELSFGEAARCIERLSLALTAEDMIDREEFLSAWGEERA